MAQQFPHVASTSFGSRYQHSMNSQVPGWVWFFTGLVAGLFLALLIYLGRFVETDSEDPALAAQGVKPGQEQSAAPGDLPFQFYDIFPRNEVPVVEERVSEAEAGSAAPTTYLLQTGSFSSAEDADRMRARLILMGLDAFTRRVVVKGETRHRVLVGPLDSKGDLNHALDMLAQAEIESIALKVPSANL